MVHPETNALPLPSIGRMIDQMYFLCGRHLIRVVLTFAFIGIPGLILTLLHYIIPLLFSDLEFELWRLVGPLMLGIAEFALLHQLMELNQNRRVAPWTSYGAVLRRFFSLWGMNIITNIVSFAIMLIGTLLIFLLALTISFVQPDISSSTRILLLITGVGGMLATSFLILYIDIRWFLAVPLMLDKNRGPFDSLSASWRMTKGHVGRIFSLLMVTAISIILLLLIVVMIGWGVSLLWPSLYHTIMPYIYPSLSFYTIPSISSIPILLIVIALLCFITALQRSVQVILYSHLNAQYQHRMSSPEMRDPSW